MTIKSRLSQLPSGMFKCVRNAVVRSVVFNSLYYKIVALCLILYNTGIVTVCLILYSQIDRGLMTKL